jgi:hypothetical protein
MACRTHGRDEKCIQNVRKPKVKGQLARPRHRWEDNITRDVKEARCESLDSTDMAQDREQWQALVKWYLQVLKKRTEFLE